MSCPHQKLAADVRIKGVGDEPREGTITVTCQECGADFGFLDLRAAAGDSLQFRIVPINRPQTAPPSMLLLPPGA